MSKKKLGYTWYPKDWGNSEKVFEMNLAERGFYRELIDLAMLNDNIVRVNIPVWSRKFNSDEHNINLFLELFEEMGLITISDCILHIPSCEARLNLSRGGAKGGKKSKPIVKPTSKPTPKPIVNQKKIKEIESKVIETFDLFWEHWHKITNTKKTDKEAAFKHWKKLTLEEQRKAYSQVEHYYRSVKDKKFLKKARTYLADKNFNDEFVTSVSFDIMDKSVKPAHMKRPVWFPNNGWADIGS